MDIFNNCILYFCLYFIFNKKMIKSSFLIISILSLAYGLIFLFYPNWFVEISKASDTNIAWLRNIGSTIVGLLFFGCFSMLLWCFGVYHFGFLVFVICFLVLSLCNIIFLLYFWFL